MATRLKRIVLALSVVAAMSLAANSFAAIKVLFNGVGSSAAFNAMALAAGAPSGGGGQVCGANNWTETKGGLGHDNRESTISDVSGNVWVIWNGTATGTGTTQVCAYLNIDSVVGNRLYFARWLNAGVNSGAGVLNPNGFTCTSPPAGNNLVPLLPLDVALPTSVCNAIFGQVFNAGMSDIRPEDALWATTRALTAIPTPAKWCPTCGLGYGPGPVGQTILSTFSSKSAQVVDFAISGNDPITGEPVPGWITSNVGSQILLVLVNSTDTSSAGLGNAAFNNVDRFVLGKTYEGVLTRTRDLIPSTGLPAVPLTVLNREPLSGTFNTFEYCVPASFEQNSSQENNVNPANPGNNPLDLTAADGAVRERVIGTGEMTSEVGSITDSLGYAFFSFGNVSGITTTAKYLAVDGVDPLYASYTTGALPTCTAPCPGEVTFPNIVDGSYPIWNILRVISAAPVPTGIANLVSAAQSQVAQIPDFVPVNSLEVFRSHYTQSGVAPSNGHKARSKEAGGDVGGAVLTVQADLDNITDTGKELTSLKQ
ncbi:MAG TPA: hypothetical protein VI455_05140 [Terriglobia bacterium]